MKRSYISIAIFFAISMLLASSLYSYSRELVCVLPFAIDKSLLEEYKKERKIETPDDDFDDIENVEYVEQISDVDVNIDKADNTESILDDEITNDITQENDLADTNDDSNEGNNSDSIDEYTNELIELDVTDVDNTDVDNSDNNNDDKSDDNDDKYSAADGIPRLIIDELNSSKMLTAINYELMLALLKQSDSSNQYSRFATDIDGARRILEPIFSIKYLISGSIQKFNAAVNEERTKEYAEIEITINVLNTHTGETITLNINKENIEAPYRGMLYTTHDAYFLESALGKALESGLQEVSSTLVSKLEYSILEATVVRISDDDASTFYINMGKNMGVKQNDIFDIYKQSFLFSGTNNALYQDILKAMSQFSIVGNTRTRLEHQPETITNSSDEVRYTSTMLADYLKSITVNEYVGKALVIKTYDNFSELKIHITTNKTAIRNNRRSSTNQANTNQANTNQAAAGENYSNTNTHQITNSVNTENYITTRPEHATNFSPQLLMKAVLYKD